MVSKNKVPAMVFIVLFSCPGDGLEVFLLCRSATVAMAMILNTLGEQVPQDFLKKLLKAGRDGVIRTLDPSVPNGKAEYKRL